MQLWNQKYFHSLGLVFQIDTIGYHPHKSTFKTHPTHENRPKICFYMLFPLIFSHLFFPKFMTITKTHLFFPMLDVFAPLNDVHTWSWKTALITCFLLQWWYLPWNTSPPPRHSLFISLPMEIYAKVSVWWKESAFNEI